MNTLNAEISRQLGSLQTIQFGVAFVLGASAVRFDDQGAVTLIAILASLLALILSALLAMVALSRLRFVPLFTVPAAQRSGYLDEMAVALKAKGRMAKYSVLALIAAAAGTALSAMLVLG